MTIGILGHAARFAVFAFFRDPVIAVAVNILHGICYAFFFATVYIFVDEFFPKDVRSSAQGLFNLLILGIGPLVGNFLGPRLGTYFSHAGEGGTQVVNFTGLFLVPSLTALFAAILLAVAFRPPERGSTDIASAAPPH
jgi:MFS family permease